MLENSFKSDQEKPHENNHGRRQLFLSFPSPEPVGERRILMPKNNWTVPDRPLQTYRIVQSPLRR